MKEKNWTEIQFFQIAIVLDSFEFFEHPRSLIRESANSWEPGRCYKVESRDCCRRNALAILSQKWTFCHLPCRFVHFSGIGPRFAIPLCGSDKELRE